jgi:repressor LexA
MARNTPELEERFKKILETLLISVSETGYPPARRTFVEKAGISSSSEAHRLLGVLEKRGFITVDHGVARGIRPNLDVIGGIALRLDPVAQNALSKLTNLIRFPISGRIVASAPVPVPESPVSYFDSEHFIEVARSMLPSCDTQDLYALEVQGDSMVDSLGKRRRRDYLKRTFC